MNFTLPKIKTSADAVTATGALLAAVAKGQVTPSETQTIVAVIDAHRRVVELEDHERRLRNLEERQQ